MIYRRRLLDLALAVPAALATAPALAVLAVAVRATSPGPAFFLQERLGRHRRSFRLIKLRTMEGSGGAAQVTRDGDRRITALGAVLRRTKLDELPQLWNVVLGHMSLVGPRPEVERYARHYRPEWERLFSVRPGITDAGSLAFRAESELLASVQGDVEAAYIDVVLPAKLGLSLAALDDVSLRGDLAVLVATVLSIVAPSAGDHPAVAEVRRRMASR